MKIQLDTNLVIDILENRRPHVLESAALLNYALTYHHQLFITANSVDNIAYILRKKISPEGLNKGFSKFFRSVDILPVDRSIILNALSAQWKDLEDAIQYYAALAANVDLIATRDVAGFEEQKIKVLNPAESLKFLEHQ